MKRPGAAHVHGRPKTLRTVNPPTAPTRCAPSRPGRRPAEGPGNPHRIRDDNRVPGGRTHPGPGLLRRRRGSWPHPDRPARRGPPPVATAMPPPRNSSSPASNTRTEYAAAPATPLKPSTHSPAPGTTSKNDVPRPAPGSPRRAPCSATSSTTASADSTRPPNRHTSSPRSSAPSPTASRLSAPAEQAPGLPEGRPEACRPRSRVHPGCVRAWPPRDG